MKLVENYYKLHNAIFNKTDLISGLGPLALRLFLFPVFWVAGTNKLNGFEDVVAWFGNSDWGLGLPFPEVMAGLAAGTETIGAILLLIGLATRWIAIPLMVTMLVAIFAVHWENGWQAIHDLNSWGATENTEVAVERLSRAKSILQEHGNYDWLTEKGSIASLNNGIEFGVTYFVMLLALFFSGGGKLFSVDYFLDKHFNKS
ncbi:DoxX family protein [Aliikangiella coralliicola]|uniref:DoxX family protein n=1 Tax=Aliikangiella coralliicola TaxID=2592383 RepID=A0A545UGT2_9GAMM|nr:DoxX family protein [Aliikangiella coralliicola]TQV88655.1 DoxX family protein [Aliikangiella coralliicola]